MLRHFGVIPYIVFDGDFLPSKAATEASRASSREEHRRQGNQYLKAGKPTLAAAEFQKSIDVTPEMARYFIEELKKMSVDYVVAPYEADAQMVYLEKRGLVDGIISEDSDLLVFGCKLLISKLDKYGCCVEINRRDFCACREVSLTGWTDADFRRMAIFSGCDYLDGLRGMGLKTAYRYLRKHKTPEKVVQRVRLEGKVPVSENYLPAFYQAELTFLHQRVFCPEKRELVLLNEDPTGKAKDYPFIGADVESDLARAIARGDVNPITKEPIRVAPVSPKRQRAPSIQAQPVTAAAPPAGSKPINSYFKKQGRIPMGEMDRNCFSISSQRVANLTHNGAVPRVFPLPRPYLDPSRTPQRGGLAPSRAAQLRRRTDGVSTTLANLNSDSDANRRHTTGPGFTTRRDVSTIVSPTAQRPPKKARLCNNEEEAPADGNNGSERSKFFPSKASKPVGKTERETTASTASKRDDLLLSDDSIEEALLSLPTPNDWDLVSKPRQSKSFAVFEDETQKKNSLIPGNDVEGLEAETNDALGQENPLGDKALGSDPERPMSTPPRLSSARVSLESFFYQPETQNQETPGTAPTPTSIASTAPSSRNSSLFTPSFGSSKPETPFTAMSAMTPLQRIGSKALQRGANTPSVAGNENAARKKRSSMDALPVNPAFVPLPRVDLEEVAALNSCGSEDQIPLIEGADEVDGGSPRRSVAIDLTRFLHR